jgi:RNA polymerase sigma-70 factor, ECF subfamily
MANDGDELAPRLESFRNYLMLLARTQIDGRFPGRLDPEDLVQQTLARAMEKRDRFQGSADAQRAAWLRTILTHVMIDAARKLGHDGRSLESVFEQSSARIQAFLAADQSSPSIQAEREERLIGLADALAALPADQRRAIECKHLQGLSLVDTAREMNRSVSAIAGLLQRGLRTLRASLDEGESRS